jgi:hypothetical protein
MHKNTEINVVGRPTSEQIMNLKDAGYRQRLMKKHNHHCLFMGNAMEK